MADKHNLRWLRLDNAAKIYPAARRRNWSSLFRLSVTLNERVDVQTLQSALDVTVKRFPSIAARLRKGVFWYYIEQLHRAPQVRPDFSYPMTKMPAKETRRCAFRVLYYENRIALEIFHSLTDGNGALVFLKTLLAEYLRQRHGIDIPATDGVLDTLEEPKEEELEDSFQKYAGPISASRKELDSWHLGGTLETDGFLHVTNLQLSVKEILDKAHQYGVTATAFLASVMMYSIQELQRSRIPDRKRRKAIRLLIPVNLRSLFPSKTLRNFAMYATPEILPRLGDYSFEEICRIVRHCMGLQITPKRMSMMIAANVSSERILAVKLMPLFIKNFVMRLVFDAVGERKTCLSISNLGAVKLPKEMHPYIDRFDFILGVQATSPYNCGVVSFGDKLNINFIRNVKEAALESQYFQTLQNLGLEVTVQSNQSSRKT